MAVEEALEVAERANNAKGNKKQELESLVEKLVTLARAAGAAPEAEATTSKGSTKSDSKNEK